MGKPDATAVTSGSSGSEAIIAHPSTETKATAGPSNISKSTKIVEATALTTTITTITASDPSVNVMEYISSKRRQLYDLLHHNDTTLSAAPSKINYQNDCYEDWLAEAPHVVHIEVSGPIFGGVAKGCSSCYDTMINGSLTPHGNHHDDCPWKRFIFCDPVVVNRTIVVKNFRRGCGTVTSKPDAIPGITNDATKPDASKEITTEQCVVKEIILDDTKADKNKKNLLLLLRMMSLMTLLLLLLCPKRKQKNVLLLLRLISPLKLLMLLPRPKKKQKKYCYYYI